MSTFEFQRKFGRFQHEAPKHSASRWRQPPRGRRKFALISAEQYDWLRTSAQRSHRTNAAADAVIEAVERAEMDVVHKPLDDLLT